MSELVLVRHGETKWSAAGRHTGVTDIPLTPAGEHQVTQLRPLLDRYCFGLVLASPRVRARRTAELLGWASPEVEPDLAEWDYGGYEGQTTAEISAALGRPWRIWTDLVPAGATPGLGPGAAHVRRGTGCRARGPRALFAGAGSPLARVGPASRCSTVTGYRFGVRARLRARWASNRLLGVSIGVISPARLSRVAAADRVRSPSIRPRNWRSTHPRTTSVAAYTLRLPVRLIQAPARST
jgi:hypothetical protein